MKATIEWNYNKEKLMSQKEHKERFDRIEGGLRKMCEEKSQFKGVAEMVDIAISKKLIVDGFDFMIAMRLIIKNTQSPEEMLLNALRGMSK